MIKETAHQITHRIWLDLTECITQIERFDEYLAGHDEGEDVGAMGVKLVAMQTDAQALRITLEDKLRSLRKDHDE